MKKCFIFQKVMKTLLFVACFFCGVTILSAQYYFSDKNRANIWHFGFAHFAQGAPGLDFNSGSPVVFNNGTETGNGTSALCNEQGNLQMYPVSRGQRGYIVNALQDTMHNSWNMFDVPFFGALWDHKQRFLSIPNPSGNGLVYVFTSGNQANTGTYEYSVLDMNLDGGLGSVIEKNHFLYLKPSGKQTAVHHSNCHDIWVVSHESLINNFYSFLVTDTGVNATPVISNAGAGWNNNMGNSGAMKLSPNGRKIAFATSSSFIVQLFDFDNSTGVVSNPITLPTDSSASERAVSFSPDGSKLYIGSADRHLYQYTISGDSAAVVASRTLIAIAHPGYGFFGMEIGPDGKIYVAKNANQDDSLAIIHNPNNPGLACNFQDYAISLNGAKSGESLNSMIQSYFNEDLSAYKCFTGIEDVQGTFNDSVEVYPNPFTDKVKITFNRTVNCAINLYDLTGKEVFSVLEINTTSVAISRGSISDGVYILKIQGVNFFHTCKLLAINPLKN